jgi:ribosomal protein S18 acetylase RimI-like enzyme
MNHSFEFKFFEEKTTIPYIKNYDKFDKNQPKEELKKFNIKNWIIQCAYKNDTLVGGMILAYDTKEIHMLEGRGDITCLWDIRVHPDYRRQGIGTQLFNSAVNETRGKNCKFMKIETQNINVNACKFYKKQGCKLGSINQYAYKDYPDEIQFIWYRFV